MFEDEKFYSELRAISSQNSQRKFVQRNKQYDVIVEQARTLEHKFRYYGYDIEVESAREIPQGLLKNYL